jgi:hypothetical protein
MTESTTPQPEQLTLLAEVTVPVQFRLDEATRRRGLRHIAEIRARLEQQSERREEPTADRRRRQIDTARRSAA